MHVALLRLEPEYRDYVWGGDRLRPGFSPTAEAWIVYENDRIAAGLWQGKTLAEVAEAEGEGLLGRAAVSRTGWRFPLLIKLLDCAQWLSLQVHPNDEQAARLEGPGFFGKTEAWHVLEAAEDARLIAGVKPGTTVEALDEAVRSGAIADLSRYVSAKAGDTIFMPPGTIHALGPGLLIYEVQQTSDLTYRVYDWGRPQTEKRHLHIEKSLAVADPDADVEVLPCPTLGNGEQSILARCPYFTLEILHAETRSFEPDTGGESFHALTVIEGAAQITAGDSTEMLQRFETVVVPASAGRYRIVPHGRATLLKAYVEPI